MDFDYTNETITPDTGSAITINGNLYVTGGTYIPTNTGVTAAGTTQGNATNLISTYNVVTTVAAGTGVILPNVSTYLGQLFTTINRGANPLLIYPPVGGRFDASGANVPVSIPVNGVYTAQNVSGGNYYTILPILAAGTNVTLTPSAGTITIASTGGGGGSLIVKDEGSNLTTTAASINFAGAGVTATTAGNDVTVTIPGSGVPTTFTWTGGTTAGPTGSLTGVGMTAVSFPAMPSASVSESGIVTTSAQTFTGAKTFNWWSEFQYGAYFRGNGASVNDTVFLTGRSGGTGSYAVTIIPLTLTSSRTLSLPDKDGTLAVTSDLGTTTNTQTIKFDTGTTEGTDLYTFNGSAAKTVNIVAGTNVTLSKTAGTITINATGGGGGGGTSELLHGFSNRTDTTLTYTHGTRNLNIAQAGGVKYWFNGVEITTGASKDIALGTATIGAWYIYFSDAAGTLVATQTEWDYQLHVPVACILYTANSGMVFDKRHAASRDRKLHATMEDSRWAEKVSGLNISGVTLENGTANSMVQWAMSAGEIADFDIQGTIGAQSAGSYFDVYNNTNWTTISGVTYYLHVANYLAYQSSPTTQAGIIGTNEFANYWVFAAKLVSLQANQYPVFTVMGQNKFSTLADALADKLSNQTMPGFPAKYCVPLYRITLRQDNAFVTSGKAAVYAITPLSKDVDPIPAATDILELSLNPILQTTNPTTLATRAKIFLKRIGGRLMPAVNGPSNMDYVLQPSLWRQKVGRWNPPGNGTTAPGVDGINAFTAVGTATTRAVATTNLLTRTRRVGYVSAATASALCGITPAAIQYTTGDGAGLGGFFYACRFAFSDNAASAVTGARAFVGMLNSSAAPTNVEPSTLVNGIGIAQLSTDGTQLYIVYGGSAAQTAIALGTNFPPMVTFGAANGILYDITLFAPPSLNGVVYYRVERVGTAFVAEGTLTPTVVGTQTPASTVMLAPRAWRTNNATLLAVGIDIVTVYTETDY